MAFGIGYVCSLPGTMSKNNEKFEFEVKEFPLEKALENFVNKAGDFFFKWPKDNVLRMIKLIETIVWLAIGYDLLKSILTLGR